MIEYLAWRPRNEDKLRGHGISRHEVNDLVRRRIYIVGEHPDYPDQVRITGPTSSGRFITVALQDRGGGGYRPVTGWNATDEEIRRYIQETQGGQ